MSGLLILKISKDIFGDRGNMNLINGSTVSSTRKSMSVLVGSRNGRE